jgi:hypothetical protein
VAAIDAFAEEQVFKHPLYAPSLVEPPVRLGGRQYFFSQKSARTR